LHKKYLTTAIQDIAYGFGSLASIRAFIVNETNVEEMIWHFRFAHF
jgi:hypothetical protein